MKILQFSGPFSQIPLSNGSKLLILLTMLVVAQAMTVIYTTQEQRDLYATLQAGHNERDQLHKEWSRLLLEQGTWQADARVERIAREQLGMTVPNKVEVIVP